MAFLNKDELKTVATTEIVDLITGSDDVIVDTIITESIEIMKSYLYRYYDTEAIFLAQDEDRSRVILKYLKDIVIHEIYTRRSRQYNEVAKERYDEAMLWLEKVSKGSIDAPLPPKIIDTDNDGTPDNPSSFLKLGSRKSYKNHW